MGFVWDGFRTFSSIWFGMMSGFHVVRMIGDLTISFCQSPTQYMCFSRLLQILGTSVVFKAVGLTLKVSSYSALGLTVQECILPLK